VKSEFKLSHAEAAKIANFVEDKHITLYMLLSLVFVVQEDDGSRWISVDDLLAIVDEYGQNNV